MSSVAVVNTWRTTVFRLTVAYGAVFAVGVGVMLAVIYWKTASYMSQQMDHIVTVEMATYASAEPEDLPGLLREDLHRDTRHVNFFGLFNREGRLIAGNLLRRPAGLRVDGRPRDLPVTPADVGEGHAEQVRMAAMVLPDGMTLVVGRDEVQIAEIRHIILVVTMAAVAVILLVTFAGMALSIKPVRRLREIQQTSELIMHGDIHRRLPLAGTHDELDMLAHIVNRMLDALERLMRDLKSTTDSIAHDLKTPLTRLRTLLHRTQSQVQSEGGSVDAALVAQAIAETDALLARFRALMRIAEISSLMRREAFRPVVLSMLVRQVHDLYAPLAEERNIQFTMDVDDDHCAVTGDGGLLFEALSNLVDNAIKFTPDGGRVSLALRGCRELPGPMIVIADSGCGIPAADLPLVTQPFHRARNHAGPGTGLGLSIVDAILRLHDFQLLLESDGQGTRVFLKMWGETFPPGPAV